MKGKPVLLVRTLVRSENLFVPLRVANFDNEPFTLYKNTNIGLFQSICQNNRKEGTVCGTTSYKTWNTEDSIKEMNVENDSLSESQISKFTNVIEKYSDIFSTGPSDMGRTSIIKHQIVTDSQPIRQGCRRVPLHKQNEIKTHVQDMLDHGVIQPSCSPWAAPVVLVLKKDGSTRFCIDYRKLNTVTKKDAYPLPRIDQTLDALANANLFSSIDLISGYWQIELDPSDKENSAFTTSCGLYEFNVMPFGLCGAPNTFQRLMETVIAGLQWEICFVYLDDVIILVTHLRSI